MRSPNPFFFVRCMALVFIGFWIAQAQESTLPTNPPPYEVRQQHDPDGIGKFYMGREIAQVMGHQAADWLERTNRDEEEKTELLVEALELRSGEVLADIGAGTGYFSRRLAARIGERGTVYAVDIQQEMLDILSKKMAQLEIRNIRPVLGTTTDPKLPSSSVDTVLLVDVYHEFDQPFEMMQSITRALKPGGRIVFVEFRGEDPTVPIKRVHKMTQAQLKKEMAPHALKWVKTLNILPRQHIVVFSKETRPQTATGAPILRDPAGK